MRTFAVINISDANIHSNIISQLPNDDENRIFVYSIGNFDNKSKNITYVNIPTDIKQSTSVIKNFVYNDLYSRKLEGYVHVIEDIVKIEKNPMDFLNSIEEMMSKLDVKSWFNTITDPFNYTFTVYNPRFSVALDRDDVKNVYDKTIYFTSHANTSWICYDFSKLSFDDIKFDENFEIPMYYIIKFLADRRNNKKDGEIYYMNFYPTIHEEVGVFRTIQSKCMLKESAPNENEIEAKIFESYNINYQADMSIEKIMDDLYTKLTK